MAPQQVSIINIDTSAGLEGRLCNLLREAGVACGANNEPQLVEIIDNLARLPGAEFLPRHAGEGLYSYQHRKEKMQLVYEPLVDLAKQCILRNLKCASTVALSCLQRYGSVTQKDKYSIEFQTTFALLLGLYEGTFNMPLPIQLVEQS